jgi:hypothetical protein
VTYVVLFGPPGLERQAIVFSLGEAARCAVRYVRERRSDVRVRLPDGEILGFEAFQEAVFAGKLSEKSATALTVAMTNVRMADLVPGTGR